MTIYLALAFGALGLGAAYALQAIGVVIVYKTSRVFNFATGGIAMLSAYVAGAVGNGHGPVLRILALILGVAVGALTGLAMEFTIRFSNSALNRTVITLGWLLGLQGLVSLLFGTAQEKPSDPLVSATSLIRFDNGIYQLGRDQVLVLVITLGLAVGLAAFFRRSSLGIAMRAVADDPEAARLLGLRVVRVDQAAWLLGGAVAGLTGVLVSLLNGGFDQLSLVAFSIEALAAALVGRLASLPLTLLGGFVLAILQATAAHRFSQQSGLNELVSLLVILVALAFRRPSGRGDQSAAGLIPVAVPPLPQGRRALALAAGAAVAILVAPFALDGSNVAELGAWSIAILSLVLLTGVVGQISLCQTSFMGIGAYVAAIVLSHGVPFLLAVPLGALAAGAAAAVVGLPALRLSPLELAIVTLSLAFAADNFLFSWAPLVSGADIRPLPRPSFAATSAGSSIHGDRMYALLCLAVFALLALSIASLRRGRIGAALTALRSSPAATSAMGFSVTSVKLRGFAMSGVVAGIAGGLFAGLSGTATGRPFGTIEAISLMAYAVIAGVGSIPWAIVGGAIVTLSTMSATSSKANSSPVGHSVTTTLTGVLLIAVLLLAPSGISGLASRLLRLARSRRIPPSPPADRITATTFAKVEAGV